MRLTITILFLVFASLCANAQDIYKLKNSKDSAIFVGGYDKVGNMKLIVGNDIKCVDQKSVGKQIDQLSFKDFIDVLDKKGFVIECSGDEPFWKLTIRKGNIWGLVENKEIDSNLTYHYTKSMGQGWSMMFNSSDGRIMGTLDYCECMCDFDNDDETTPFKCHICVDGVVYQGCAYIKKKNNDEEL